MPKRKREIEARWLYRREGLGTIYGRDRSGRYVCFRLHGGHVRPLPGGITTLPPIFGRVNFANNVRFVGRTRSQSALAASFNAKARKISTGWKSLPQVRTKTRRQPNQGMNSATRHLTGAERSATRYAIWCDGQTPAYGIKTNVPWEWCHLLSHSMGGANNETNIVAAVKGNNSEQLAIESALQMYRCENMFEMRISAACLDNGNARHIGDTIKYEIRCRGGGDNFVQYLDCLNAPAPSSTHFYDLLEQVALWANKKLVNASNQLFNNGVTKTDQKSIISYISQHM